jgi:hypothetical protein
MWCNRLDNLNIAVVFRLVLENVAGKMFKFTPTNITAN